MVCVRKRKRRSPKQHVRRLPDGRKVLVSKGVKGKRDIRKARTIVKKKGFKTRKADLTKGFVRFRQEDPKKFKRFRVIDVGRPGHTKLVIGVLPSGKTKVQSVIVARKDLFKKRR